MTIHFYLFTNQLWCTEMFSLYRKRYIWVFLCKILSFGGLVRIFCRTLSLIEMFPNWQPSLNWTEFVCPEQRPPCFSLPASHPSHLSHPSPSLKQLFAAAVSAGQLRSSWDSARLGQVGPVKEQSRGRNKETKHGSMCPYVSAGVQEEGSPLSAWSSVTAVSVSMFSTARERGPTRYTGQRIMSRTAEITQGLRRNTSTHKGYFLFHLFLSHKHLYFWF